MKDGVKVKKILREEFNTEATSARCTFNIVDFKFWIYICTDHIVDADTRAAAEKRFIEEKLCGYWEEGLDYEPEIMACVVWMGETRRDRQGNLTQVIDS